MRTPNTTAARDTVTPTLHKAQDTLTDTVLPAVRDAIAAARERGSDLLTSDAAHEARRRSTAVVKAARGQAVVVPAKRWRFGLGMIAIGTAFGYGAAWLAKRLATPIDSYTQTLPVPSGTDGGTVTTPTSNVSTNGVNGVKGATNGAAPAGTSLKDIDLAAGAPTVR